MTKRGGLARAIDPLAHEQSPSWSAQFRRSEALDDELHGFIHSLIPARPGRASLLRRPLQKIAVNLRSVNIIDSTKLTHARDLILIELDLS